MANVSGASLQDRATHEPSRVPPSRPSRVGIPCARQMQMNWHTEAGEVLFYYPSDLSEQDAQDVRDLLSVALKGIDRRAQAIEAQRAETATTGSVEDESAVAKPCAPNAAESPR